MYHTHEKIKCGCQCEYCAYCYNGCPQCGKGKVTVVTTTSDILHSKTLEQRFNEKFGFKNDVYGQNFRNGILEFINSELANQKKELNSYWLKTMNEAINNDIKAIKKELAEYIKGIKHRCDNSTMSSEREAENRAFNRVLNLLTPQQD